MLLNGENQMTKPTFTLSIETTEGHSYLHGFHLGTIESIARQIAQERFHARIRHNMPTVTVALLLDGKMFDCYDGDCWSSEYLDDECDGLPTVARQDQLDDEEDARGDYC